MERAGFYAQLERLRAELREEKAARDAAELECVRLRGLINETKEDSRWEPVFRQ
jgi:hypothetical protein